MAGVGDSPCEQGGERRTIWLLFGWQVLTIGMGFAPGAAGPLIVHSLGGASILPALQQATMMLAPMSASIAALVAFGRFGRQIGFLLASLSSTAGYVLQALGQFQGSLALFSARAVPAGLGFGLMKHIRSATNEVPAWARRVMLWRTPAPYRPMQLSTFLLRSLPTVRSCWKSISSGCWPLSLAHHAVQQREPATQLMAVIYTDMVGYSRLFALDNLGTAARIRCLHHSLFAPAIRRHSGRLRQTAGDSMLITFDSVAKAVQCAVTIQRALAAENEAWSQDLQMHLRIGVDFGDIIIDSESLHGEGIIVAARLQAVCPPGGICVSRAAHDRGGKQLGLPSEALGPLKLKNVDCPVEALLLRPASHDVPESKVIDFARHAQAPNVSWEFRQRVRRHA